MRYTVVLEQGEDGGWGASFPELDGLFVLGDTRAEVLKLAPEAIEEYLADLHELGASASRVEIVALDVPAVG